MGKARRRQVRRDRRKAKQSNWIREGKKSFNKVGHGTSYAVPTFTHTKKKGGRGVVK